MAKIKDDWHEKDAEPRCERWCPFILLGHWLLDPHRDFHGPLRDQVPGLASTSLHPLPGPVSSDVQSCQQLAQRQGWDGQEAKAAGHGAPQQLHPELQVLQPGQLTGKDRLGDSPVSMPGWSWKPQGLIHFRSAQAGWLAPSLRTKGRDFGRRPTRGLRRETQSSPFSSLPNTISSLALEIK